MKSLWISVGYCLLNSGYHGEAFELASQGQDFEGLSGLHRKLLADHLTPGRYQVMALWELLTRTRFDDVIGPLAIASAADDTKFKNVRAEWMAAGNPEIRTDGHQMQLAAVVGLAALDVAFRDALFDAADPDDAVGGPKVAALLRDNEQSWGRYVLNSNDEVVNLNRFVARMKPLGRSNPLEVFHELAWIQPRKTACPLGISHTAGSDESYAYLSHSAFLRNRWLAEKQGAPSLAVDPAGDLPTDRAVVRLDPLLRDAGILIERT